MDKETGIKQPYTLGLQPQAVPTLPGTGAERHPTAPLTIPPEEVTDNPKAGDGGSGTSKATNRNLHPTLRVE